MVSFKLVRRYLTKHLWRSLLTIASLVVALFLVCVLRSLLWSLDAGIRGAKRDRLVVQSAVSLFVNLPMSYQPKFEQVQGVENSCKFHWFGAYYKDEQNFFAQFACDPKPLQAMYPELEIVGGSWDEFFADPQGCVIGKTLAEDQRMHPGVTWKLGDVIPLISMIYPAEPGQSWQFRVRAIYHSKSTAIDERTMFFPWDYFQRTLEAQKTSAPPEVATYSIRTAPGADQVAVAKGVEELFENGPQRVTCTSEAEFQAQFVTMLGSIPLFLGAIGGGVLVAILFACVNTMLMAFREQMHDVGILKALGFTDGSVGALMLAQSLLLCGVGGLLGLGLAKLSEPGIFAVIGAFFPGYAVTRETLLLAAAITLVVGLISGIAPYVRARRLQCVAALRSVE
jgi:putative ABC transport system permease protein